MMTELKNCFRRVVPWFSHCCCEMQWLLGIQQGPYRNVLKPLLNTHTHTHTHTHTGLINMQPCCFWHRFPWVTSLVRVYFYLSSLYDRLKSYKQLDDQKLCRCTHQGFNKTHNSCPTLLNTFPSALQPSSASWIYSYWNKYWRWTPFIRTSVSVMST